MILKTPFSSRSPRRGQALILAVLVMLFATLLSAAFLVLVASTSRQVGRETDRVEASRNADAGVDKVKQWLVASATPDTWDPTQDTSVVALYNGTADNPPVPGEADYDFYWSQLDKTMGWADPNAGFAKYPDPRTSRQAAQFLVSAHVLGKNEPTPGYDDATDGGDKRFMLRITVIGLSTKNPEAWTRRVMYKTTNWNGATLSFSNLVTNTAFVPNAQGVQVATELKGLVDTSAVGGVGVTTPSTTVTVPLISSTATALMAQPGNTIMLSDDKNEPIVGVVQSGTATSVVLRPVHSTGTVTTPVTTTYAQGSKVTASMVGSIFQNTADIDTDGASTIATTAPQNVVGVTTAAGVPIGAPFGNGAFFNDGVSVPTTTTFGARPPVPNAGTNYAGQNALTSTGPMVVGDLPVAALTPAPQVNILNVALTNPAPTPFPTPLPSNNRFVRLSFLPNGQANADTFDNQNDPEITPRRITPALIDLKKYASQAKASGLYIDNPDDVEKFGATELTTSQLQRFWQRKSFPVASGGNITYTGSSGPVAGSTNTTAARLCYPRPGPGGDNYTYPMSSGSLEQLGIRGWISPWEFLPRGAQIILNGTTLTVVQDPLSDTSSTKPDPAKAFDATTRNYVLTGTPANGIIAAEGNLRVRGNWTGAPLTIAAGGNIYIEGSVTAPAGRVALLSKKNVVLNPTQFIARPVGTVDTSVGKTAFLGTAQSGAVQLTSGVDSFKLGDTVAVFASNVKADGWHTVNGIDTTTNTITFATTLNSTTGNFVDGTPVKVKLACDPPIVLIKGNVADSTTDFYAGKTAPGTTDDTRIDEFDPATNPATAGTAYAYKFAVGGDTLARNVPFNAPVGVAMRETVAKKNLIFTVQGGQDPRDPVDPADDIDDDGKRNLESRTSTTSPFELSLAPKSGAVTDPTPSPNSDTFDLTQLAPTPVPPAPTPTPDDATVNLANLQTQLKNLSPSDTDDKTNRWRLVLPAAVAPATTGVQDLLAARRLSITSVSPALGLNPDDETTPTSIRVPLTSSVVLFSGTLATTAPDATALSRIGSTFGFQQAAIDPANETRFVKAADLAKDPVWDQPTPSGTPNVVKYTQTTTSSDIGWTRDGAGDYNDQLPTYYVSGWRFQKVAQDAAISPNPNNVAQTGNSIAPSTTDPIKTNMTVEVDATIYAEGGSWFVIPVPTPNANSAAPADPDQLVEWRRPAYDITVNGNIAQMMTPTATVDYDDESDPDGVATGAMKRWTDSLSYQVFTTDTTTPIKWQTIRYQAAPLPALVNTTTYAPIPQLPASADILYTYSN